MGRVQSQGLEGNGLGGSPLQQVAQSDLNFSLEFQDPS
jgi:hypothetical protein